MQIMKKHLCNFKLKSKIHKHIRNLLDTDHVICKSNAKFRPPFLKKVFPTLVGT